MTRLFIKVVLLGVFAIVTQLIAFCGLLMFFWVMMSDLHQYKLLLITSGSFVGFRALSNVCMNELNKITYGVTSHKHLSG